MKGFLAGTLLLVALQVGLQPGSAGKASQGSGVLLALLRRLMDPRVAGVPDHRPLTTAHALPKIAGGAGGRAKAL